MNKLLSFILSTIILTACSSKPKADNEGIARAVDLQFEYYPKAELMDLYKSFFQDNFGPGHIAPDSVVAYSRILDELQSTDEYGSPYYEPAGRGMNFYRVSLQVISDSLISLEDYFDAFYSSIKDVRPVDVEEWKGDWKNIKCVIDSMNLSLPGYDAQAAAIDSLLSRGEYAYHHSRAYNENYKPHYRLIRKDIFEKKIKPLIDGNSSQ